MEPSMRLNMRYFFKLLPTTMRDLKTYLFHNK
jgi:hypothetical protein